MTTIIEPNKVAYDYLFTGGVHGVVFDGEVLPGSGWVKLAYPEVPFVIETKPMMVWDKPQRQVVTEYTPTYQHTGYWGYTSPVPDVNVGVGFILGVVLIAVLINRKMK